MIHRLSFVITIVASLAVAGCVAPVVDTSKVTYVKPGFGPVELSAGGLAILPVTAGSNVEGYRRPFGAALNHTADSLSRGEIDILPWEKTMDQLNQHDLAGRYQDALIRYKQTAIIDKKLVQEMAKALGLRYFLFVELMPFEQDAQLRPNALTGGVYTQESLGVQAIGQVWDAVEGDVVWEGVGGAKTTSSELTYIEDRSVEAYSGMAANGLMSQVFGRADK